MAAKAILVFCAQALLIQSTFTQCVSPAIDASFAGPYSPVWTYDGLPYDGLGFPGLNYFDGLADTWPGLRPYAMEITPTAGGLLPVTSSSGIPPVGISIVSENAYEGLLAVAGEVPFVGTTGMEGTLPTGGTGAINYGCGNGVTTMVSEVAPDGFGPAAFGPAAISSASFAPGIGSAITPSLGCGASGRGYLY